MEVVLMRRTWFILPLALVLGVGAKKSKTPPAEPPPAEPPAAETPAPPPPAVETPAEPTPPPPAITNADFKVTLTYADGTKKAGHVKRLEKSTDWFGEADWTTDASALVLTLASGSTEVNRPFTDAKSIQLTLGKLGQDVDCNYDSDFTPWMYDCTLKNITKVTTKDGKVWTTETRNKWRLTFDDDSQVEFWFSKYPVRMQDTVVTEASENAEENTAMYEELQVRIFGDMKKLLTGVAIQ